jgi:hypothetical protein
MDFYGIAQEEGTVKTSIDEWAVRVSDRLDNVVTGINKLNEEGKRHLELLEDIRLVAINLANVYIGQNGSKHLKAQFTDSVRKMRSLKSKLDSP